MADFDRVSPADGGEDGTQRAQRRGRQRFPQASMTTRRRIQPALRRSPRLLQNNVVQVRRSKRIAEKLKRPLQLSTTISSNKKRKTEARNPEPFFRDYISPKWMLNPIRFEARSLQGTVGLIEHITSSFAYRYRWIKFGVALSQGIGLKGSRMLIKAINKEPLRFVALEFRPDNGTNGLAPYHLHVFRTFYKGITGFSKLENLRIKLHGVSLDLSKLPPALLALRMEFSDAVAERKCLQSLATGLRRAKFLTELQLDNWTFDHEGMRILSLGCTLLTDIAFIGGNWGDDCVAAFVDTWRNDSPLRKLKLCLDETPVITHRGMQQLLAAASHHPALKSLHLSFQETVQADIIKSLARALPELQVSQLIIYAIFPANTNTAAKQQALRGLFEGIKRNYSLCDNCSFGGVDVIDDRSKVNFLLLDDYDIDFYDERNWFGARLLRHHGLPTLAWCHILSNCAWRPSILYSLLRERPELVRRR
jgi:hypothetical protein